MDAYGREGGVKNPQNHAYVIYGCPQRQNIIFNFATLAIKITMAVPVLTRS